MVKPTAAVADTRGATGLHRLMAQIVKPIPLVGPPLSELILDATAGPIVVALLLVVVFALLIYPLVLLLALCWALQSSWFPGGLRQYYAEQVRLSFKVDESARAISTEGNQRLDYFQQIELGKSPDDGPQLFTLRVKPFQEMFIYPKRVNIVSLDPGKCPIPKALTNGPLFSLKAGKVELGQLSQGQTSGRIPIDFSAWESLSKQSDDEVQISLGLLESLPPSMLKQLSCPKIVTDVRLAVEVYKDVIKQTSTVVAGGRP